jgi:hypothetical protein
MSRKTIIVLGAISWAIAIAIGVLHLLAGDLVVPAIMVVVAGTWLTLRLGVLAPVPVDSKN